MKKNVTVRVLCLVIASVVLSGAVAFAAFTGSPYETLKNAMLDALMYRNATVESLTTVTVNGELRQETKSYDVVGDDSGISYTYDDNGDAVGYNYYANGLQVWRSVAEEDGTQWYCADVSPRNESAHYRNTGGGFSMISPEDRNSSQMRFIELVADALIGDLKNNITMSSGDGVRLIRGTLTESQVPELAKAGIDMLIEMSSNTYFSDRTVSFDGREYVYENIRGERGMKTVTTWKQAVRRMTAEEQEAWDNGTFYDKERYDFWGFTYIDGIEYVNDGPAEYAGEYTVPVARADFEDREPLEIPIKSLAINYVHGEAEVDADGNMLYIDISGTATVTDIFGTVSTVEASFTARFSDIGTSDPVCAIPGAEQLLTSDYMKAHFGNEYMSVFFTLNPDGSISADSITTTYPGEMAVDKPMAEAVPYVPEAPAPAPAQTDAEQNED